jgi:uncharacterized membrane protein (DUF2068 family)
VRALSPAISSDVPPEPHRAYAVTAIACFEALKGLMGLAVGAGVLSLLHKNVASVVENFTARLHLDLVKHHPQIFLEALSKMHDPQLWMISAGAALYATVRMMMAYGLWHERGWAEWLTAAAGGIYIPFELYELERAFTWPRILTLAGNMLIVCYMLHRIRVRKAAEAP